MSESLYLGSLIAGAFILGGIGAGVIFLSVLLYRLAARGTDQERLIARMRAEIEAFRREVDRALRSEITTSYGAWVIANQTGHIIDAGGALYRLAQRRPVELIGQPIAVLIPATLQASHEQAFQRAIKTGTLRQEAIAGQLLRADGTLREIVVRLKQVERNDATCIRADLFEIDRDDMT